MTVCIILQSNWKTNALEVAVLLDTHKYTNIIDSRQDLISQLSKLSVNSCIVKPTNEWPKMFYVKYLGSENVQYMWGIDKIREPIDNMVAVAKKFRNNILLPLIEIIILHEEIIITPICDTKSPKKLSTKKFSIEKISYATRDNVYTKIWSMIVVHDTMPIDKYSLYECHGFVCKSKHHAEQITIALENAFKIYLMK
ncbi:uncharacterized protein LOC122860685, partial [Aphidius gifuensis]|uniref:uncharacterized protein LOC122860685 n=1 Tax=Aphidius gifuensis TaxID=684658 RepID=UPI001CDC6985